MMIPSIKAFVMVKNGGACDERVKHNGKLNQLQKSIHSDLGYSKDAKHLELSSKGTKAEI